MGIQSTRFLEGTYSGERLVGLFALLGADVDMLSALYHDGTGTLYAATYTTGHSAMFGVRSKITCWKKLNGYHGV